MTWSDRVRRLATKASGLWWLKPLLVILACVFVYWGFNAISGNIKEFFFGNPEVIEAKAETVNVEELNEGLTEAATQGMEVVVKVERERTRIDHITVRNDNAIKEAADAGLRAPGVYDALNRALCLRTVYKDEPGCAALLEATEGERAVGPDAGSSETAE